MTNYKKKRAKSWLIKDFAEFVVSFCQSKFILKTKKNSNTIIVRFPMLRLKRKRGIMHTCQKIDLFWLSHILRDYLFHLCFILLLHTVVEKKTQHMFYHNRSVRMQVLFKNIINLFFFSQKKMWHFLYFQNPILYKGLAWTYTTCWLYEMIIHIVYLCQYTLSTFIHRQLCTKNIAPAVHLYLYVYIFHYNFVHLYQYEQKITSKYFEQSICKQQVKNACSAFFNKTNILFTKKYSLWHLEVLLMAKIYTHV